MEDYRGSKTWETKNLEKKKANVEVMSETHPTTLLLKECTESQAAEASRWNESWGSEGEVLSTTLSPLTQLGMQNGNGRTTKEFGSVNHQDSSWHLQME